MMDGDHYGWVEDGTRSSPLVIEALRALSQGPAAGRKCEGMARKNGAIKVRQFLMQSCAFSCHKNLSHLSIAPDIIENRAFQQGAPLICQIIDITS